MHHRFIDFFKMYESVVGVFADLASINVLRSTDFYLSFHKKFMIMTFTTTIKKRKEKVNVKIGTLKICTLLYQDNLPTKILTSL